MTVLVAALPGWSLRVTGGKETHTERRRIMKEFNSDNVEDGHIIDEAIVLKLLRKYIVKEYIK